MGMSFFGQKGVKKWSKSGQKGHLRSFLGQKRSFKMTHFSPFSGRNRHFKSFSAISETFSQNPPVRRSAKRSRPSLPTNDSRLQLWRSSSSSN